MRKIGKSINFLHYYRLHYFFYILSAIHHRMLKRTFFLLTTFLLLVSSYTFAQNKPVWPKTFLWRISGNGLTKESYLYGTMHLQDKRLFNFGDSLYRYMEKADGYALEIDMDEMIDSLFQRIMDEKSRYSVDEDQMENVKSKKKYIDSLVSNVKEYKDKVSRKILQKIREGKMNSILKKEMPTMMDAFLYGIAKRQGKWLGGIEDLQDQLPLLDELGGDVTSEEILSSGKEIKAELEKMISVYVSRDLDKVESMYLKDYSNEMEDLSLNKRNKKMASRMDSLAHVRSMFFTVGVAHLPGELGVITLLRKQGFRVDPVFPAKEVDPMQYVSTLKSVVWEKISDANKTYEIEMPGKSAELSVASGIVNMKYCVDMTTLTFFMSTSSVLAENADIAMLADNALKAQNAVVLSKKNIELSGLKGIEVRAVINQNYFKNIYLRKENILYILFVGGQKKEAMTSPDADHFVASFTPAKELPIATVKNWKRFNLDLKGCNILFPGDPIKNPKMAQDVQNGWNFTTYDFADPATSTYYILQIRDIVSGLHLTADSSIFLAYRERFANSIQTVSLNEETTLNGYPVLKYEGSAPNGVLFKSLVINRGNRVYYVIVEGQNTPALVADMNNFLHSFNIVDYQYKDWNMENAGNFLSFAPATFVETIDTGSGLTEKNRPIHYICYDSVDCTSYEVLKYKIPPYYYAEDDSTLFMDIAAGYRKATDSVLSEKWVTNGNLKGQEWIVQSPGNNNVKKARIFINGDTLYQILCYLPFQKINDGPYERFFTNFKVLSEVSNAEIYKRKFGKILTDLQSSDSAVFADAQEAFLKAKVIASDKKLLEEALLKDYPDDASTSYNTRDRITDSLHQLMDENTLEFIKEAFPALTGKREFIKMCMLDLLARYQTQYSFDIFKELLLKHTPQDVGSYVLTGYVGDSLELAKSLYPEILQLSNNPLFVLRVMGLSSIMVDNGMVPLSMLEPYSQQFVYAADTIYDNRNESNLDFSTYKNVSMLNLMRQLNSAEGNRILKKYLGAEELNIKQAAIEGLLKNGQVVDPKEIAKVAADKSYRKYFYEALHKIGKTAVFPLAYSTQQSIAEADLFDFSNEQDYEPAEMKSLGVKTFKYKGKNCKMYLFRLTYEGEDKEGKPWKEFYLGMSGPFSADPKDLITDSELTTIFFDAEYNAKQDQSKIDSYLRQSATAAEVKKE